MMPADLVERYRELDRLKVNAAAAPTREERERHAERWQKQELERTQRHDDAERARAEEEKAKLDERERKIRESEARRQAECKATRDRVTAELAEARNAISVLGAGNTDAIPLEMAERLRAKVWLMAAEQLVVDAEAALAKQRAANGTRGRAS